MRCPVRSSLRCVSFFPFNFLQLCINLSLLSLHVVSYDSLFISVIFAWYFFSPFPHNFVLLSDNSFKRDIVARLDAAAFVSTESSSSEEENEELFRYREIDVNVSGTDAEGSLSSVLDRVAALKGKTEEEQWNRRDQIRSVASAVSGGVVEQIWTHLAPLFIAKNKGTKQTCANQG